MVAQNCGVMYGNKKGRQLLAADLYMIQGYVYSSTTN